MGLELVDKPKRAEIPTVEIDFNKMCEQCGEFGATHNGLCMKCVAENISEKIEADREPRFFDSKDQQFAVAKEAKMIALPLIAKFHKHLVNIRIDYIFLSNTPTTKGTEVWGRAKKITGLAAWYADEDREENTLPDVFFVIELSWEVWKTLDEKGKRALIDHELSHCIISDDLKPCLRPHDCEEFNQVIRRNGLWRTDVRLLLEAAEEAKNNPLFKEAA